MFDNFFKKDKKNAQAETSATSETQTDSAFTNLSADKLKAIILTLNEAEPVFIRAGYQMEQLDVEFGREPKLTPHFRKLQSVSEQQHDQILTELEDRQLIKFILISLNKSSRMQSIFEGSELYFYGMEIDISSVPTVRTIFKRKEPMAEVIPFKPES